MSVPVPAEGFAAVPNWMIRDKRFDIYDIAVYAALASHTGPGGVRPSQATLADEARCSERQVRIVLARLVEHGLVEVTRRRRSGTGAGRHGALTNGYILHPHGRLADDEETAHDAGTSDEPAHGDRPTGTAQHLVPLIEEEPVKEEPGAAQRRGTRIPQPFIVTSEMVSWAREHAPLVDGSRSTQRFENYWLAKTGKDATKLDWKRTWQNWLLKDQQDAERLGGPRRTTVEVARSASQILAERRAARESGEQKAISA